MSYVTLLHFAALLTALALFIWAWLLRKQVQRQTRSLERELSERRQMEEDLRDSGDYFKDLTEAASDWIWETDEQLRFSYLSDRFYELTGIERESVLGRTRWELVTSDPDVEKWRCHRETMEQHKPFRDFTYKPMMPDKTGRDHYFKITGKPVFDNQGRFQGYRGMGTDITEQVKAEIALQESERTLATLMGNLPGMAYRCRNDRHWTAEFISNGSVELIGYRPEQLIHNKQMAYVDLIHPDDTQRLWQEVQTALTERRHWRVNYRINTATGEQKWVWEQGCGIFSLQGDALAFEGFITDITEQKRAEEAMTRMRIYLKNILDSMPLVLVVVDTHGRITEWNQAAQTMSDSISGEAKGRFFAHVFPQLEGQWEQIRQAIAQGRPTKTQRINLELHGVTHYADVMVYPLIAEGTIGAVIKVDDVTAQVRIQEMMVQTEKMLSVGGLAAGMAHEINNPLGAISQSTQNIFRRISPALPKNLLVAEQLGLDLKLVGCYLKKRDILHFLDNIHEMSARAAKIVSDMLTFSRRSELVFAHVDLPELLDTAVRLAASDYDLKKKYDFKRICIQREYDPALKQIYCDKTEIEQVVLNLVKNASQAMADNNTSAPKIILRTRLEPRHACIEVCDNGPGMDEKSRKRVFEPFFTTKEVGVGTGLGLSVSYFIVKEQHQGDLSVISSPGQGARFSIRLPLHEVKDDALGAGSR